jgi:hypothetical protein
MKKHEEKWDHALENRSLWQVLESLDADLARAAQAEGCGCGGKLHRADYRRKPRGGPAWGWRDSFCCGQEGCRRRRTPPSVRFLGRRVYVGFVVVLVAAMRNGATPGRVRQIQEKLGIDRRTLERWRRWWLGAFVEGSFWRAAKARFIPLVCEETLPASLCERFRAAGPKGLTRLLSFLAPITAG